MLSKRQNYILKLILENKSEFITIKHLAYTLSLSSKTIYRDIKEIQEKLNIKLNIIPGKGIKSNNLYFIQTLINPICTNLKDYSPKNRRYDIYYNLLINSPKKTSILNLANEYYVSSSSIINDIKYIEKNLLYDKLQIKKEKNGTNITGLENDIRFAITSLINSFKQTKPNIEINSERLSKETYTALCLKFGKKNVDLIEKILSSIEKKLFYTLGEVYYINFCTHILIMINRIKNGNMLKKDIKFKSDNSYIYKIALEFGKDIENNFNIKLNLAEINQIYKYMNSLGKTNIENNNKFKKNTDIEEFLNSMPKHSFNIKKNKFLYNSFYQHALSMINRTKYDIKIVNPLLENIKEKYKNTYLTIENVIKKLDKNNIFLKINESEISYITLYFQALIESKRKNAIIVCSSGIGTSVLLKKRLEKNFSHIKIKKVLSLEELYKTKLKNIDFVISTIKLHNIDKPCIYISALLTESDIKIMKEFLKNYD